jgi:hypothetical protein
MSEAEMARRGRAAAGVLVEFFAKPEARGFAARRVQAELAEDARAAALGVEVARILGAEGGAVGRGEMARRAREAACVLVERGVAPLLRCLVRGHVEAALAEDEVAERVGARVAAILAGREGA